MLTGQAPHQAETGAQAWRLAEQGAVQPVTEAAGDRHVPAELAELAMEALRFEPVDRIPTARAFLERLRAFMSGTSRRAEAAKIVAEVEREFARGVREYADCQRLVAALDEAFTLWPQVPGYRGLRDSILHRYGALALIAGDVGVARAAGRSMDAPELRQSLLQEADNVELRRERTRRRLLLAGSAAIALALALLVGGGWSYRRISAQAAQIRVELGRTESERRRAVAAEGNATEKLASSLLSQAAVLIEQNRLEEARAALWQVPEGLRNWEWGYELARAHPTIAEHDLASARFDGRRHRIYGLDPLGRVVTAPLFGGEPPVVLEPHPHEGVVAEASRPGGVIVTVNEAGTAVVRSGDTLETIRSSEVGTAFEVSCLRISDDPGRLAIVYTDGTARVWDARGGGLLREFHDFGPGVRFLDQSDDGGRLLAATEQAVHVYDLAEGRVVYSRRTATPLQGAALSPSGRFVVSSESQPAGPPSVLRDLDAGRDIPIPCHGSTFGFNEGAGMLVAADDQWSRREVHVVDLATGSARRVLHDREEPAVLAISPRGDRILLGSPERVGVWETRTLSRERDIPVYGADLDRADFAFHGRVIGVCTQTGRTSLWDAYASSPGALVEGSYVSVTPDAGSAISIGWSWAELTDLRTGRNRWLGGWDFNPYRGIIPWADGGGATALGYDLEGAYTLQAVRGRDFAITGELKLAEPPEGGVERDDPAGRLAFIDRKEQVLRILDVATLAEVASIPLVDTLEGARIELCDSVNHRFWLVRSDGSYVSVDSDGRGQPRVELGGTRDYRTLLLTDGVPLVGGVTADLYVQVHRLPGGERLGRVQAPKSVASVAFSLEGDLVAMVSSQGECIVARTADGGVVSQFRLPPSAGALRCRFLPGGARMFLRAGEGARVLDVRTGREVVSWRTGFGDLSGDGGAVVLRDGDLRWGVTLVAPFDAPRGDGPGREERHQSWLRDRMRQWIAHCAARQLPSAHRRLRAFDENTVQEAIGLAAKSWAVSHCIEDLSATNPDTALVLADFWGRIGIADPAGAICPLDLDRAYLAANLAGEHPGWRGGPGQALNAALLLLRLEREEGRSLREHAIRRRNYEALGRTLAVQGEKEAAIAAFNRGITIQRLMGDEDPELLRQVADLGGTPPGPPPAELVFDAEGRTAAMRELAGRQAAEGRPPGEASGELKTLRSEELARAAEFVDRASPLDPVREAVARLTAAHATKGIRPDARFRDVARETEDAVERAYLGGMTWEEAAAECRRLAGGGDPAGPGG